MYNTVRFKRKSVDSVLDKVITYTDTTNVAELAVFLGCYPEECNSDSLNHQYRFEGRSRSYDKLEYLQIDNDIVAEQVLSQLGSDCPLRTIVISEIHEGYGDEDPMYCRALQRVATFYEAKGAPKLHRLAVSNCCYTCLWTTWHRV